MKGEPIMANLKQECLAIIPARGGSKGIPRKNIRLLAGKPLIGWTIEAAREARSISRVVVSTDDAEIAGVARGCGAEVIMRPPEISGDTASSESALQHVVKTLEMAEGYRPDLIAFLQCSSPLMLPDDIDGTVRTLVESQADSALTVAAFHHFLWKSQTSGNVIGINHDKSIRPRRQDREPQYLETGAVYVMKADGFRAARHRFFGKTVMHEIPAERAMEIDEPADLILAETFLRRRQADDLRKLIPNPLTAVIFDFDGVFTDNGVWLDQDGREAVVCRRDDGIGIDRLKRLKVPMLVLSAETNPVVAARCRKLGLQCIQGCAAKQKMLSQCMSDRGIDPAGAIYLGNDVNDVDCLKWVGCGVVVADAYPRAREAAKIILTRNGGNGAVRELCDLILEKLEHS
jgi:YrbI family 3-deoxy-D-manno-octulosonate 8-phosphate phosphatase